MSSPRAGRVSRGGRRKSTSPPGSDIKRKKAASICVRASMLRTQGGNAPRAVAIQSRKRMLRRTATRARRGFREALGNNFNVHPLRTDVVGDVFTGHDEAIRAGN